MRVPECAEIFGTFSKDKNFNHMKYLTATLIVFCIPTWTMGQIPVTDVGLNTLMIQQSTLRTQANVTMASQLTESVEQTTQLSNTFKLMKEANDKLKKISSFINKYSAIAHILQSQRYQYNRIKRALGRMSNSKYVTASDLRILQGCSSRFLKNTNELIGVANSVVTPHKSEMNDSERISLLMRISDKIDSEATAINYAIKNIEETERQRAAMANANRTIKRVFTGKE